jgi:hypothetical protein
VVVVGSTFVALSLNDKGERRLVGPAPLLDCILIDTLHEQAMTIIVGHCYALQLILLCEFK